MPAAPIADWQSDYEDGLVAYYEDYQEDQSTPLTDFWGPWAAAGTDGLATIAPFAGSNATTDPSAFAPLDFSGVASAADAAIIFADAWKAFMNALTWSTIPPTGPFATITSIKTSQLGLTTMYATLLAGLIAELSTLPPDPGAAMAQKAAAISALYRAATVGTGVEIDGFGPGGPPPPVFVPQSPTM